MIARPGRRRVVRVRLGGRELCVRAPKGVHPVDSMTPAILKRLPVRPGDAVLDLGCGTGVYGLACAFLGASRVLLTDIDPGSVRCARANARAGSIRGVAIRAGDFFEPARGERFDLIIANLPQTPGPRSFLPFKWGGRDGLRYLRRLFREAPRHLRPGGRLCFLLHDLADSARAEALVRRRFRLRTLYATRRRFSPRELDEYLPGLFAYLERRRAEGKARFHGRGVSLWFRLRFLEARLTR